MTKNNKKYVPVLVVDFGSQTTQLILRRIREIGIYCEAHNVRMQIFKHSLIVQKISSTKNSKMGPFINWSE